MTATTDNIGTLLSRNRSRLMPFLSDVVVKLFLSIAVYGQGFDCATLAFSKRYVNWYK